MSILQNSNAISAPAGGADFYEHQISQSVRLGDSGYLKRTPSGAGNRQTWTFSTWIKLSVLGINSNSTEPGAILNAGTSGNQSGFYRLNYEVTKLFSSSAEANFFFSTGVYRDTSAWQHIVWKQGGGTATVYVNGVAAPGATASVSGNTAVNNNVIHCIGGASNSLGEKPLKGYLAETIMIDGTALGPDSFGEEKNGVWIPKDASGLTFGTNGFHLDYADASALGNDVSGNNNDWTTVNLAAHDQMIDSPTFGSSSSGNFATYNFLNKGTSNTLTEGNLQCSGSSAGNVSGTMAFLTGKWYWEQKAQTVSAYGPTFGIGQLMETGSASVAGGEYYIITWQTAAGAIYGGGGYPAGMGTITVTSTGVTALSSGDVMGFWLDLDNNKLWITKNGAFVNSGNPATGANPQASWASTGTQPMTFTTQNVSSGVGILNAGQNPSFNGTQTAGTATDKNGYGLFKYDPSGTDFIAMCSGNLPVADEVDPAQTSSDFPQKLFSPLIYTGNGSNRSITGLGFKPDLTWFKARSNTERWTAYNSTRGTGKYLTLNTDGDEGTDSSTLSAFGSDGFSLGTNAFINGNSTTFANFSWRANGGTTSSNSNGSITSTVQVDPSGCFSIGTYTGTAQNATIGHGLSKKPDFIVIKSRAQNKNWMCWSSGLNNDTRGYIQLSTSGPAGADALWNNTAPTSSVFSVNYGTTEVNAPSGQTYQFYAFANCEGYIKAGSYKGNGNADGTFVYTGFKPSMVLVKFKGSGENWGIVDNKRNPYNVADNMLRPSTSGAESDSSTYQIDILSNGFKPRTSWEGWNGTGSEGYLYLAFAQNPFKYSTAR